MAWRQHILNDAVAPYLAAERRHPYLTALAQSGAGGAPHLRSRLENLVRARRQEAERRCEEPAAWPYHLVVDPSSACNLRCPLCVQSTDRHGRSRTTLGVDSFKALIDALGPFAVRLDLFNWGEPFLNPDFLAIVSLAAQAGLYTRTSSSLTVRRGFDAEAVVRSGLHYLVASIDGVTQETYERYRVRGRVDVAVDAVGAIAAAKRRLGTAFPIIEWQYLAFSHNTHEVEAARRLAAACGADLFRYGGARARMSTKTLASEATSFALSKDILLAPEHELSEYDARGGRLRADERDGCRWLWGKMAVNADGGVSPCWNGWFESTDLGNVNRQPVGKIWNGPAFQAARAAATTPATASDSMCGTCAAHRNFVPTPDFDREDLFDPAARPVVERGLESVGVAAAPDAFGLLAGVAG